MVQVHLGAQALKYSCPYKPDLRQRRKYQGGLFMSSIGSADKYYNFTLHFITGGIIRQGSMVRTHLGAR